MFKDVTLAKLWLQVTPIQCQKWLEVDQLLVKMLGGLMWDFNTRSKSPLISVVGYGSQARFGDGGVEY